MGREHTEYSAIEYEFVPAMLVPLEDLDVDDTKDEVEDKKNNRKWHVRHNRWCSTQAGIQRRVRRTSSTLPRCSRLGMISCMYQVAGLDITYWRALGSLLRRHLCLSDVRRVKRLLQRRLERTKKLCLEGGKEVVYIRFPTTTRLVRSRR
jgi:hypothetical protein